MYISRIPEPASNNEIFLRENQNDPPDAVSLLRKSETIYQAIGYERGQSILETACGNGHLAFWMSDEISGPYYGSDISFEAIRYAKRRANSFPPEGQRLTYHVSDINHLPFKDNSIDIVINHASLHHLDNPLDAISEMYRVARNKVFIYDFSRDCDEINFQRIKDAESSGLLPATYSDSIRAAHSMIELSSCIDVASDIGTMSQIRPIKIESEVGDFYTPAISILIQK